MSLHAVEVAAHAKANLFLRVLGGEADGYHGIETLFCRLDLADTLWAERREGQGVTVEVTGADVGPAEANLAVRAAHSVLGALEHRFAVHLTLTKRIPVGAGLGGGSADAAAALLAVNRLAGDAVPRHELLQFAARLGSDVPFCLSGAPLALGWGRGERMLRLPALPPAFGLVLSPAVAIPTAEAYRWVDAARESAGRRGALALDLDALSRWGDIARMAGNDFESPVFARHPEIRSAFEALVGTHPVVCRMTGSGSSLLAIYRHAGDREDAQLRLGRKHGVLTPVETAAHPAPGPQDVRPG
ncbi:MAG TPA: 4-(cytidine 5'-diphospho)-2-C-methyl-D-erythritol kinase [Gemmatimonadales bacterium]|nr:4-(cytidine 5'-diphospho)-2-C-methyl-D-erythritol kinase [Gemmatimonadales bacterium]